MDLPLKKDRVWLGDHDSQNAGLQDFMINHTILKNVEFNSKHLAKKKKGFYSLNKSLRHIKYLQWSPLSL